MVDNRIPVELYLQHTLAQLLNTQLTGCTKFTLCCVKMVLIALIIFGPDFPLLFKLHRIWLLDSR